VLIIPQCETRECLEHIEQFLAIPGIDGIFIGPFDLSIALGKPGQFTDPEITGAFERVLAAGRAAHKPVFIYAPTMEAAQLRREQGYDSITYSSDLNILIESFQRIMRQLQGDHS
jgi:4-hydroxy-2-oxoheptanedioate aldolase